MGNIYKGKVASISGNYARVVPLDEDAKPTTKIMIPWHLRGDTGVLKKGTEVVYVEFADSSGLLLGRADGEWGEYLPYLESELVETPRGDVKAQGVSLAAHTHTAPHGETSGPHGGGSSSGGTGGDSSGGDSGSGDSGSSGGGIGADGKDGEDGFSPTVSVTAIPGGHRVSITDVNGTQSFDVMDGEDGKDGQDATDGKDGTSPTVTVTEITGGHRVSITDAIGTQTFDVKDGKDGADADTAGITTLINGLTERIEELELVVNPLSITVNASDSGGGMSVLLSTAGILTVEGKRITAVPTIMSCTKRNIVVEYTLISSIKSARKISVNGTLIGTVTSVGDTVSSEIAVADGDTVTITFTL